LKKRSTARSKIARLEAPQAVDNKDKTWHASPLERDEDSLIGAWSLRKKDIDTIQNELAKDGLDYCAPEAFFYDGNEVIIRIAKAQDWMWSSADEHHRLSARLEGEKGEELFMRTPFDGWVYLATWHEGRFHKFENSVDWPFRKREPLLAKAKLPALFVSRALHNYNTDPVGGVDPGWQDDDEHDDEL